MSNESSWPPCGAQRDAAPTVPSGRALCAAFRRDGGEDGAVTTGEQKMGITAELPSLAGVGGSGLQVVLFFGVFFLLVFVVFSLSVGILATPRKLRFPVE